MIHDQKNTTVIIDNELNEKTTKIRRKATNTAMQSISKIAQLEGNMGRVQHEDNKTFLNVLSEACDSIMPIE